MKLLNSILKNSIRFNKIKEKFLYMNKEVNNQLDINSQDDLRRNRKKRAQMVEMEVFGEKIKIKRGQGSDARRINERIKNFDPKHSPACRKINKKFGLGIIHEELRVVAEFLCQKLNLVLDRDAKRDNRALRKWYDENWDQIAPEIDRIELLDKEFNVIIP